MEDLLVIESGKTRTGAVHGAVERIDGEDAHIVGPSLAKSTGEASDYGFYQYNAVGNKRNPIVLTLQQAGG
ncbi:MAG TPA: hypothetical protein VMN38_04165 [Sphingomicrobium sp.]|nr:hypothetical protein [Sphingomicrobium sp.]